VAASPPPGVGAPDLPAEPGAQFAPELGAPPGSEPAQAGGTPARRLHAEATDEESPEAKLIRQARAAIAVPKWPAALGMLDKLVREFPRGAHADARVQLVRQVCTELRGTVTRHPLCAGERSRTTP